MSRTIKFYTIELKLVGDAMIIPDSHRILGWLAQRLTEDFSESESTQFISSILDKRLCMISNLLPSGYYPMPKIYFLSRIARILKEKNEDISIKEKYEALKKVDYIQEDELRNWIRLNDKDFMRNKVDKLQKYERSDGKDKLNRDNFLKIEKYFSQKCKISSQYYQIAGLKNELYSVPFIRLKKLGDGKRSYQKDYRILIKTENAILQEWLDYKHDGETVFLGPRSSQGFNSYKIKSIQSKKEDEVTTKLDTLYLNIGRLLPNNNINFEQSFLTLHTSPRKPMVYGNYQNKKVVLGEEDEVGTNGKDIISFIEQGSVIKLNCPGNYMDIGNSIPNPFNKQYTNPIVFGNSYLVKI